MILEQRYRLKLLFFGGIISFTTMFQMGYSNSYPNTAHFALRKIMDESLRLHHIFINHEGVSVLLAALASTWFLGYTIGLMVSRPIADKFGRKKAILTGNIGNLLALSIKIVSVKTKLVELLFFGRFLSAIATGICSCPLILFLEEISPIGMRATMGYYPMLGMFFADACGIIMGMTTDLFSNITILLAVAMVPCVLSIVVILPFPETPKYELLAKNDRCNAFRSLVFYQGDNCAAHRATLDIFEKEGCSNEGTLTCILKTPHLRLALACGVVAQFLTVPFWFFLLYSTTFLTQLHVDYDRAQWTAAAAVVFTVVAGYVGMNIADQYGRRLLLLGFGAVNTLCLVLLVACAMLSKLYPEIKDGCLVAIIMYFVTFSIATGPIAWFLPSELVTHKFRATVQSYAMLVGQIITLVLTLASVPAFEHFGPAVLLLFYVFPNCMALLFLYLYLPETFSMQTFEVVASLVEACKPKRPPGMIRSASMAEQIARPRANIQTRAMSLSAENIRTTRRTSLIEQLKQAKRMSKLNIDPRRMSTVIEIATVKEEDEEQESKEAENSAIATTKT